MGGLIANNNLFKTIFKFVNATIETLISQQMCKLERKQFWAAAALLAMCKLHANR